MLGTAAWPSPLALAEIAAAHHRRRYRRRQLEVGNDAADHGDRLSRRSNFNHQRPLFGNFDHGHRLQSHAIRPCDEEHEGKIGHWIEVESSIAIRDQHLAAAYDGHPGTGEGGAVRGHNAAFERSRSCGRAQQNDE